MATDSIKGLTEQVKTDLAVVYKQIGGMQDQIASADTPELQAGLEDPPLAKLDERKFDLETIQDDIVRLLEDIGVAESHGWPTPQKFTLSDELAIQFTTQNNNLDAAEALFGPPVGESIDITMSAPKDD